MKNGQSLANEMRMELVELLAEIEKEEGKIKLQMKADLEVIFYSLNELERLLEIR